MFIDNLCKVIGEIKLDKSKASDSVLIFNKYW